MSRDGGATSVTIEKASKPQRLRFVMEAPPGTVQWNGQPLPDTAWRHENNHLWVEFDKAEDGTLTITE